MHMVESHVRMELPRKLPGVVPAIAINSIVLGKIGAVGAHAQMSVELVHDLECER